MPKFLKFLIGLGVVVAICLTAAWVIGAQWFARWAVRKTAQRHPIVLVVPKPLADASINKAVGTDESFGAYGFEVPWKETPIVANYGAGGTTYSFGAHVVTIYQRRPDELMAEFRKNPQNEQNLNNLFEGEPPRTDYDFMYRILNVSPGNFTWSASKMETVRNGTLLALKTSTAPAEGVHGIFYVKTPEFQGFQYGVPEGRETGVAVDLYGKMALLKMTFRERGGAPAIIPQPDINRVVQSMHALPSGVDRE